VRRFEEEILLLYLTAGRRTPRTGWWVRGHLLDVGTDYQWRMWKRYLSFLDEARERGAKIEDISYRQFRIYLWFLKKLGLITVVERRRDPDQQKGADRAYITITPDTEDHPGWINPIAYWLEIQRERV